MGKNLSRNIADKGFKLALYNRHVPDKECPKACRQKWTSSTITTYYYKSYFKIQKDGIENTIHIPQGFITGGNLN